MALLVALEVATVRGGADSPLLASGDRPLSPKLYHCRLNALRLNVVSLINTGLNVSTWTSLLCDLGLNSIGLGFIFWSVIRLSGFPLRAVWFDLSKNDQAMNHKNNERVVWGTKRVGRLRGIYLQWQIIALDQNILLFECESKRQLWRNNIRSEAWSEANLINANE